MESALHTRTGIEVVAELGAPTTAVCPSCGEPVELRTVGHNGSSTWYYRHIKGAGSECEGRVRPLNDFVSEQLSGDPYQIMATQSVVDAVVAASEGDVPAILSLAFSPLVYAVLDTVQLSPEEILEGMFPADPKRPSPPVTISDEEVTVLIALRVNPGPVFDIRHNGAVVEELAESPWYIPLHSIGPAQMRMVRWVMRRVDRVYVLGDKKLWSQIAADPSPGPVVGNVIYARETPRETFTRSRLQ